MLTSRHKKPDPAHGAAFASRGAAALVGKPAGHGRAEACEHGQG